MNVAVRPDTLNIISLCTGGGGLDLGVELAMPGARSVVLVEREAFAASHLVSAIQQGLMAPAAIWSDVTTFNGRPWRGLVDGLIGGIPCQPHSLAGKRLGEEDERDLWSDARRIIVQSGAWFVLIENVRGIVSSGGAERVWRDLCRLGFDVEAGLFTASEVGASHERERWFCLAVADSESHPGRGQFQPGSAWSGRAGLARVCGEDVADAGRERDERRGRSGDVLCAAGAGEGQGHQRQRHGDAPDDCGDDLAHADSERLEGLGADAGARGREDARRQAGLCDGTALVHAERTERRPYLGRRHEPHGDHGGRDQAASRFGEPSPPLVNSAIVGWGEGQPEPEFRGGRDSAAIAGPLFPPGPSDLHSWRHILERAPELEPAFRRVADGLASRLDVARVDRLRLLGNGVVSLEAAYALRTLCARLAATGSAGAKRLVRMMATYPIPSQEQP